MFEKLENRRMFAATAAMSGRVLQIIDQDGTIAADVKVQKFNGGVITVSDGASVIGEFLTTAVDSILFEGKAGNDRFEMIQGAGTRRLDLPLVANGGDGNDTLISLGGVDRLDGGNNSDSLVAGAGNDRMFGGAGRDTLEAAAGADVLDGGTSEDRMDGGESETNGVADADTISYEGRTNRVTVRVTRTSTTTNNGEANESDNILNAENITGGNGSDVLVGDSDPNVLRGNGGRDKIKGLNGDDDLRGGSGDDFLFGGNDRDTLRGEAGRDLLLGGAGVDSMLGGSGDDMIFAQDGNIETVDGGSQDALDFADVDANDAVNQIEELTSDTNVFAFAD